VSKNPGAVASGFLFVKVDALSIQNSHEKIR